MIAMTDLIVHSKYKRRSQFRDFHKRTQRWAILVCHRRAGKTVATLNDLIMRALQCKLPRPRYAFVFPLRNQAKDASWSELKYYTEGMWATPPYENELRVELINGASIRLYGSDNPDALRGSYLDGVVLDEFSQMKSELWGTVIRPMLADRQGWATFIGTPRGRNEFHKLYVEAQKREDWYHMMLRASESGLLNADEMASLIREYEGRPDEYAQEFECQWEAAIRGAFYATEMAQMLAEGRITELPIEKSVRTHTSWDLGISDSTAICFWQVGRERRLVDYYESSGVGLDHYVRVLNEKRIAHDWTFGEHFFPHDIKVKEFSSGKSRLDTLAGLGIEATVVPEANKLDGINAVRRMLGRTWIDVNRCERAIEALRQYRREYDDRLRDWKSNALHDWTSHCCDAVRYFATGFDDSAVPIDPRRRRGSEPPRSGTHWSQ
jgi:phage terminase large subunit